MSPVSRGNFYVAAERGDDQRELLRILGPSGASLSVLGTLLPTEKQGLNDSAHRIEAEGASAASLVVGPEDWPLLIPIVKQGER